MRTKVLITGVEPFTGFKENPSEDVAKGLSADVINGFSVVGTAIAYDSRAIRKNLLDIVVSVKPKFVLMMGQSFAPEERRITLERVARKRVDYSKEKLVDNTGYQPEQGQIIRQARGRIETEIDVDRLEALLAKRGMGVVVSDHAGYNFCNETYFHVLAHREELGCTALFAHLPPYKKRGEKWGNNKDKEDREHNLELKEKMRDVRLILGTITENYGELGI